MNKVYIGQWVRTHRPHIKYVVHLRLLADDDGYSAIIVNLPGIGSDGKSKKEAVANALKALKVAIAAYGDDIPWVATRDERRNGDKFIPITIFKD